jgi:hypothetical protein
MKLSRNDALQRASRALISLLTVLLLAVGVAGCADGNGPRETWAEEIRLHGIEPITVLPGTTLVVRGEGFVSKVLGTSRLRLTGTFTGSGGSLDVDLALLVEIVSEEELQVALTGDVYQRICPQATGELVGVAVLEVASLASGQIHTSPKMGMGLRCRPTLEPYLVGIDGGSYHLNAVITVLADDLLLGGDEGATTLRASGCFLRDASFPPCAQNGTTFADVDVPLTVLDAAARQDAVMVLTPDLVGVFPGTLEATIGLVNHHADDTETYSAETTLTVTVLPSRLDSVEEDGASLGGYVDFLGAGFVGGGDGETTELDLVGTFTPDGGGPGRALDLTLIASFDSGERARYVLDEQDSFGQLVDLRTESGTVSGTFTPRIVKDADSYTGAAITGSFRIEPVRQVVYLNFTQGYRDALELFGLRAADEQLRTRIQEKARWIYRSLGVEFTDSPPEDYVWYAQVDLTGIDPNGLGLMGYDNSPGKDVGNIRLYDRIGGVNALTQEDGYPGYGGIFVESFLAFSEHPPEGVSTIPSSSPVFDDIFDPFRPGHGNPVDADELAGLSLLTSGEGCPAGDRSERIRCAIFVLGNLLGTTMAHELGHSLGLSDPGGNLFHNPGEAPNRLMDSGAYRPFLERAELDGGGPEVFCQQNYDYLRSILPTSEPDPLPSRPNCY